MRADPAHAVFLPDFVGSPICYFGIRARLAESQPAIDCNYLQHWPYASVPELAHRICEDLPGDDVGVVVGYSFGAHVAIEVAARLVGAGHVPRLVLVDPPALADVKRLARDEIATLLRTDPQYAYLHDLVACELASFECMEGNLAALARVEPPLVLHAPATILIAGDNRVPPELHDAGAVHHLAGCDHRSILAHPDTLPHIVAAMARRDGRTTTTS